jgi:hypothetical protein
MKFTFEERPSDAPFVEGVWRTQSEDAGTFMSVAGTQWQFVVMKQYDKTLFTVRGPETRHRWPVVLRMPSFLVSTSN